MVISSRGQANARQDHDEISPWLDETEANSNLSRSQMLMWLGQAAEPQAPLYNTVFAWRLKGDLDIGRFEEAFNRLVTECDALRTVIDEQDLVPRQRQLSKISKPLEIVDLSEQPEALDEWLRSRARVHLRLDHCVYDSALIILGSNDAVWYLNQHHIVTDATSWALLFQRLGELYDGEEGAGSRLRPFAQYVEHERATRTSERSRRARISWNDQFKNAVPNVPIYGARSGIGSALSARESVVLDDDTSAALKDLAEQSGIRLFNEEASLFTLFALAELVWLHRASGRRQLTIGVPIHNRGGSNARATPGLLMEVFPLAIEIEANDTLRSLLEKIARATIEVFGSAVPGVTTPATSRSFDVLLNFISVRMQPFADLSVQSKWVHAGAGDRGHKLRLQVHDFDATGRFHLDFDFDAQAFDAATRRLAVRHLVTIIDGIASGLDTLVTDIQLLSDAERQRNIKAFNATQVDFSADTPVCELITRQAKRTPDAIAVQDGDHAWNYAELDRRANQTARVLANRGARPGRAVLICMDRSMHAISAILGVIKTGAAYVPVDIRHPQGRIAAIVADLAKSELGSPVVALSSATASHLVPGGVPVEIAAEISSSDDSPLDVRTPQDNLAYIIYTSGSTGTPKGVMIPQRAMVNYLGWARNEYCGDGPSDFALHSSLAVDLTVTSVFVPLLCGGRVVVYPDKGEIDLPILRVFAEDAVDVVKLTPAHLSLIREAGGQASRIRTLILGGEDLKRDLVLSVASQFPGDTRVYNEYGPTEATVGCMTHRFDAHSDESQSVPIGRPIANARVYVLDSNGRPAPEGLTGELCIGGSGIALGYLNQAELTAESFVPDAFLDDGVMYRSGDLARFAPGGRLEYLGRRDDQVKIRGARVELGEVEAGIADHPDVKDVVALLRHPEETVIERCVKCGVPSNYPGIVFNEHSTCSMCLAFDLFEDQARAYFKKMHDFREIAEQIKQQATTDIHCVALTSGGKDSTYMLYQLVACGLRPLLFTLDNGFISEEALANVARAADDLGLELVVGSTPHMNEIFADSLNRYSNVCHGCFKTIYTLSLNLARERGLKHIVTGLSRGQIFETRLDDLFRHRIFDVETIERSILEARKVYHRVDDAVARALDVSIFSDDSIFSEIQFVDFYRYCDAELDDIYEFLDKRAPWVRPGDTGRSTNCLVNDVGIYVHNKERGYHNYALPYSWDVRIGHKTREAALYELDDELDTGRIQTMLGEIGYHPKRSRSEPQLIAYYTARYPIAAETLRSHVAEQLPSEMVPAAFVRIEEMPLSDSGKVDRKALPALNELGVLQKSASEPPETDLEKRLATIWREVLDQDEIGRNDNFFDRGGVSLGAIQAMSRVRETFGVELPVHAFFSAPTIAAVAQSIEQLLVADIESLTDEEVERLLREEAG